MINRYADDLTDYFHGDAVNQAYEELGNLKRKRFSNIRNFGILILICNLCILLLRRLSKDLAAGGAYLLAKISDAEYEYVADTSHWAINQWGIAAGIFVVVALIAYILYTIKIYKQKAWVESAENTYNELLQTYHTIAAAFEE